MTKSQKKMFPGYTLVQDKLQVSNIKIQDRNIDWPQLQKQEERWPRSRWTVTIWIQLSQHNKSPLLIQALYRQFNLLGNKNKGTPYHQQQKWSKLIDKWSIALDEGLETITLGDCTFDLYQWEKPEAALNSYQQPQRPLVNLLKEKILNRGVTVINNHPTRNYDVDNQPNSCLDLTFTNRLKKIVSHQTITPSFSDHAIVKIIRRTKELKHFRNFIQTRNFT